MSRFHKVLLVVGYVLLGVFMACYLSREDIACCFVIAMLIMAIGLVEGADFMAHRGHPTTADKLRILTHYQIVARYNCRIGIYNQVILVREHSNDLEKLVGPAISVKLVQSLSEDIYFFMINPRYNPAGSYMTGEAAIFIG